MLESHIPLIFPSYFPQPDFGPASKSAITCRIRRAVTKGPRKNIFALFRLTIPIDLFPFRWQLH